MHKLLALLAALMFSVCAQAAASKTIEMKVDGLVCAFCAQGIEKKLRKLAATDDVFVSLESGLVAVSLKAGQDIADGDLHNLLKEAGYTLVKIQRSETPLSNLRGALKSP